MGEITLNHEDSMRILNNAEANPDARVIAACAVAFLEARNHADEIDPSTATIALKLSHMVAAQIYSLPVPTDEED